MGKHTLRIILFILLIVCYSASYFLINNPTKLLFYNQENINQNFQKFSQNYLEKTQTLLTKKIVFINQPNNSKKTIIKSSESEDIIIKTEESTEITIPLALQLDEKILSENLEIANSFNQKENKTNFPNILNRALDLNLSESSIDSLIMLSFLADIINPENTALSVNTSYRIDLHKRLNTWLNAQTYHLFIINFLTLILITFVFSFLISRRSIAESLKNSLKKHNLEESDAKVILLRILPHLLFPLKSSENVIETVCERYRIKLNKISRANEIKYFQNQSIKIYHRIEQETLKHNFSKAIKGLTQHQENEETQSLLNKINQLERIEKFISWVNKQIFIHNFTKDQSTLWSYISDNINSKTIANLESEVANLLTSNALPTSKPEENKAPKTNQIKFIESSETTQDTRPEQSIDPQNELKELQEKFKLDTYNQYLIKRLALINDFFGEQHTKEILKHFSEQNITEQDIYELSLLKNEFDLKKQLGILLTPKKQTSFDESSRKPLLDQSVLLAGGDPDQYESYLSTLSDLGANKISIVFQNNKEAQSKIKSDYDVAIYIATKISHSLRFALTNQINKQNTKLLILNHSRSGFRTELQQALK